MPTLINLLTSHTNQPVSDNTTINLSESGAKISSDSAATATAAATTTTAATMAAMTAREMTRAAIEQWGNWQWKEGAMQQQHQFHHGLCFILNLWQGWSYNKNSPTGTVVQREFITP